MSICQQENLSVLPSDPQGDVKLGDFGLAKFTNADATQEAADDAEAAAISGACLPVGMPAIV
jgi:hypothetical protein